MRCKGRCPWRFYVVKNDFLGLLVLGDSAWGSLLAMIRGFPFVWQSDMPSSSSSYGSELGHWGWSGFWKRDGPCCWDVTETLVVPGMRHPSVGRQESGFSSMAKLPFQVSPLLISVLGNIIAFWILYHLKGTLKSVLDCNRFTWHYFAEIKTQNKPKKIPHFLTAKAVHGINSGISHT